MPRSRSDSIPLRKQWLTQDSRKVVALVGSTQGRRPVIRLADNSGGFQDPDRPCAIVHIWNQRTDDNTPPPVWTDSGARQPGEGPARANGFNMIMRGIDVNAGTGNPGAVGISFRAAQSASLEDVKVTATGAFAGIYHIPGRGMGAANVEVDGGQFGIICDGEPPATVAGAILRNQTQRALVARNWGPVTLVGFEIVKETAPAIELMPSGTGMGNTLCLVDGSIQIRQAGGPAIDNRNGATMYARNVYVSGADAVVQSATKPPVPVRGPLDASCRVLPLCFRRR